MIVGKESAKPGEAKNSWLTGTAAWNWYALTQFILGIKPGYTGLEISPCIPKEWPGFTVNRHFRGADFEIKVENPHHVSTGVKSITLNGEKLTGNVIPTQPAGSKSTVIVEME